MDSRILFKKGKSKGFSFVDPFIIDINSFNNFLDKDLNIKVLSLGYFDKKRCYTLSLGYFDVLLSLEVDFFDISVNQGVYVNQGVSLFVIREDDKDKLLLKVPAFDFNNFDEDLLNNYIYESISFYIFYCLFSNTNKKRIFHFFSYSDYLEVDNDYLESDFQSIKYYSQYFKSLLFFSDSEIICKYFSKLNIFGNENLVINDLSIYFGVSREVIFDRLNYLI